MPAREPIMMAACAPRSIRIGGPSTYPATKRMLAGRLREPKQIALHVKRFCAHHVGMLRRAGAAGADVAVIPEDSLRLVPMVAAQWRTVRCRDAVRDAYDHYLAEVGAVCREYDMFVVGGVITTRRRRYYNTAVMLDPARRPTASYAKTHLPAHEPLCLTPGRELPVFDTPLGRVGMLICWDIVFPEPFSVLALKGAQIIFEPTFGHWRESDDMTARSRVFDWRVPLVVSMWGGCAGIIGADGEYLARTGRVGDSMAVAPVDLHAKQAWTKFTDTRIQKPRDRRPDLYGELVKRSRRRRR